VKRPSAKLSHEDAAEIRELCEIHLQCDVAKLFRVHAATVSRARRGLSWRENDDPAKPHRPATKLSPNQVADIRRLSNAVRHSELAGMFGINRGTVWSIVNRRTWRDVE
jgi:hypothetical protein